MGQKTRSARGVMVDFDLLKIKQEIAESPEINVAARENFVERRLRRRAKRVAADAQPIAVDPTIDVAQPEERDQQPFVDPQPTGAVRPTRKVVK